MTPEEVTPHNLFKEGMQHLARGDFESAVEQLAFAQLMLDTSEQPPYGELEIYLGLCLQRLQRDPDEANACLQRAHELLGEERYTSIVTQWNKPTWADRIWRILGRLAYVGTFPIYIPDEPDQQ